MMRSRSQREGPLDLLLHTALDAVIVMSADGNIAEWNECATDMFGWSRAEPVGRNMAELIIPQRFRAAHPAVSRHVLVSGRAGYRQRFLALCVLQRESHGVPAAQRSSSISLDCG